MGCLVFYRLFNCGRQLGCFKHMDDAFYIGYLLPQMEIIYLPSV